MGYRSDVKIVFYLTHGCSDSIDEFNAKRGSSTLPFAALKLWFDENYPVMAAKDEWGATIEYGEDYILLNYHDVKWYESYEHPTDVRAVFEKFSETFRSGERDHSAQYEFVRLGEDALLVLQNDDDVERESSDYSDNRINVERSMVFE